jgi:hypothetical protein
MAYIPESKLKVPCVTVPLELLVAYTIEVIYTMDRLSLSYEGRAAVEGAI